MPDKWEFANENFQREKKELLSQIRRRKTVTSAPTQVAPGGQSAGGGPSSASNSGEDMGSTSTSSPDSKNPGSVETTTATATATATAQAADLSGENEKLKRDNEMLSSELVRTKQQCDELIAFLTGYLHVGPDQINRMMGQGSCGASGVRSHDDDDDDEKNGVEENGESLKLFGVWLKGNRKRARDEKIGFGGAQGKEMKVCN